MNPAQPDGAHSPPCAAQRHYAVRDSALGDFRLGADHKGITMQGNFTGFAAQSERPATFQAYPTVPDGQRLPDKRSLPLEPLVAMLLDQLDYGVVLLRDGAQVVHLNHAARAWVLRGRSLDIVDGMLRTRCQADASAMAEALAASRRGLRRLVTLGAEGARVAVALIPISDPTNGGAALTALVFGRSRLCEPISVQWFARAYGLTPAESTVLELLSDGLEPCDIARANAVTMATVRTQIKGIRAKTCAASIRELMHQVALLPPMVCSLRC